MKKSLVQALQLGALATAACVAMASAGVTGPEDDNNDNGGGVKTVTIDTREGGCLWFDTGSSNCDDMEGSAGQPDLMFEPWCTERPGVCGNWVEMVETDLDAVTTPPESGYISDVAGYEDCQEVTVGQVIVFKLSDGSFAKGVITNDDYIQGDMGCDHVSTLQYVYPM